MNQTKLFSFTRFLAITLPLLAVVSVFGFLKPNVASAATVASLVDHYVVSGDAGFNRSLTPMSLSSGGGTISQTTDGSSIETSIDNTNTYSDSGFYVKSMRLGDFKSVSFSAAPGSASYGTNLWFDKDANGEFFVWDSADKMSSQGGDAYALGPSSQPDNTLVVDDSTIFNFMPPASGSYTLAQLKNGAVAGITRDTKVTFWTGTTLGAGGSASSTIETFNVVLAGDVTAQDFGVMDISNVKGYTAGFGLTDATIADTASVVVKLYSGDTLLQTNTLTPKFIADYPTAAQFSGPFDVLGTFDYVADGYWNNVREGEFGKNLIPTKVVATIVLKNGKTITAENTNLTGDTKIIVPPVVNTNTGARYLTIQEAVTAATAGDTIALAADATTTAQITLDKQITIDGRGHTIRPTFAKASRTDYGNNSAIGIQHFGVTVKNITLDGAMGGQVWPLQLHGINVYVATSTILDSVNVINFGGSGVVVNGSEVTATNLNASGNKWDSVNVDPGQYVVNMPSIFTLVSGNLADATQIKSDGDYVTASTTVSAILPIGYNKYSFGTKGTLWTNKPIINGAAIERESTSYLYPTLNDALVNASSATSETIKLLGNATTASQINIDKAVTIDGQGFTLGASFLRTDNSNNSALGVHHDGVVIKNLTVDGTGGSSVWKSQLHGINVYLAKDVTLDAVKAMNFGGTGINVNGSLVTVNNVTTTGNVWGGINFDRPTVSATTTLTINGVSTHSDVGFAVWKDDNAKENVTLVDTNNQYVTKTYIDPQTNITGTYYVLKPTLKSISIIVPATKLAYLVGEGLNTSGLVVLGTYSDNSTSTEAITAANITGFNNSAPATDQVLVITVNGKTASYKVNIAPVPTPAPITNGGGGGGYSGGSGGGVVVPPPARMQRVYPDGRVEYLDTPAVENHASNNAAPFAGGQVLGVSTFNFTRDFGLGSRGDDITELQKQLISGSFLAGVPTGYFGKATRDGVKKFQIKNHLPATGFVGAKTRAVLNGAVVGGLVLPPTANATSTPAATNSPRFNFTLTHGLGSRGDSVIELQKRLIGEGLLSTDATGYYGKITSEAVKKFQAKNGIPATGLVGPMTRAALNK